MSALTDELGPGVGDVLDALPLCDDQPPGVTMRITDHIDPPDHVEPIHNRAPVLVPAFPAVLRAGLLAIASVSIDGVDVPVQCVVTDVNEAADGATVAPIPGEVDDTEPFDCGMKWLAIDLRDPTVRDVVVRALWRKLRPDEPEPFSPPHFHVGRGDGVLLWWLTVPDASGIGRSSEVAAVPNMQADSDDRALALAAVCVAVLGAS
jgi:hypothetical protein